MVVFNSLEEIANIEPCCVALGNFDGVHVGHARLLSETIEMSKSMNCTTRSCALCFDPFPADFFSKSCSPHIMSLDDKLSAFKAMGLDGVYVCEFGKIFDYSPDKFICDILVNTCNCIGTVCGFNYRFGANASGTPDYLAKKFSNFKIIDKVSVNGQTVSSSLIKSNIERGNIETANELLGHIFSISHTVVHGKNLGTKLGFPTLNYIFSSCDLVPAHGIYATRTESLGKSYISVTNIGKRPTVSSSDIVTCETHIIDCESNLDLYGSMVKIFFYKKIRDEKKFSSFEALSNAIAEDVRKAKEYFIFELNDN